MRRHVHATPIEPPPLTLNGCLAIACNEVNSRVWAQGRKEWNDADNALGTKILCMYMRKLGSPYTEVAARMEASDLKPVL